jgi:hypothetical protein
MTQSNQTKNTIDDLRQHFGAALEANYPGTTANKQFLDHCMMFATQTKQETIQACKEALPSKEDRFNDMDICFCGTVIGVDGSDFPRRVSHQDCPAIKAIDTAHTAFYKLGDK